MFCKELSQRAIAKSYRKKPSKKTVKEASRKQSIFLECTISNVGYPAFFCALFLLEIHGRHLVVCRYSLVALPYTHSSAAVVRASPD